MNHMNPKVAWTILIIFLVIVLGVVGYFGYKYYQDLSKPTPTVTTSTATPATTTDETADWKTYTNDSYGFLFKYPNSEVIVDWFAQSPATIARITHEKNKNVETEFGSITFLGYDNQQKLTPEEWIKQNKKAGSLIPDKTIEYYIKSSIDSREAYSLIWNPQQDNDGMTNYERIIFIFKDNKVIEIVADNLEQGEILNRILPALKFN